ncbi:hypothetical protein [Aeromonas sp. 1HA1]|uniref:hypothetical protein n=1 Tax=Aeromonas sp. 1HA1 TaxID=2699193 RepID=UPI0023DD933C|nr:hypothetical protein [Aeromonas sp. 1HA1]MDF2412893.1 hypothetical protein [Aeromonas sp. 1HA1]
MKKYAISSIALAMVFSSGAAFATGSGTVSGPVAATDVTIGFIGAVAMSHTLNAVRDEMNAGDLVADTILANGIVDTAGSALQGVRLSITNGTDGGDAGGFLHRNIPGNTTGTNILKVKIAPPDYGVIRNVGAGYVDISNDGSESMEYSIKASVNQTVMADTYTINVSAQRWVE